MMYVRPSGRPLSVFSLRRTARGGGHTILHFRLQELLAEHVLVKPLSPLRRLQKETVDVELLREP